MTPIAPEITAFLRQRLAIERGASPNTCDSYAYAFQLLFAFASRRLRVAPSDLQLEQLDAALVLSFLDHLRTKRGNSATTRNTRLTAIKSFMRFIEYRKPGALEQVRQILALPMHRTDRPLVRHLTQPECQALLDTPDPTTRLGIRDRAMIHLGLAGGLRVSELVGIYRDEVTFDGHLVDLRVRGKGRKERRLRLWKAVAASLRAWMAVRGDVAAPELFVNAWNKPLTRYGFTRSLAGYVEAATGSCPSLRAKKVSPHTLRHTCAMNVLAATRDIRKVALWLGHASTETAEKFYLPADPMQKLEALAAATPAALRPGKFTPPDRLIASLRGT